MISQPSQFSVDDLSAIQVVSVSPLMPAVWADDRLADLKSRAKKHYITEQDNRCCYCDEQWLTEHGRVWDLEHVVPKAVHPDFMFEPRNLAAACPDCNNAKHDNETLTDPTVTAYPSSAASFLVIHPHFDHWEEHIDKSGLVFRPLSDKGTWTVKHCKLGRFALKYIDPMDETDPFDQRFESSIDDLTADRATAQAALARITAYLAGGTAAALP